MEWLAPWHPISDLPDQVSGMERELHRELSPEHPLYDLPVRALARRQDCDDVLFQIADGTDRVAVVHLTWKQGGSETPPWPISATFPNFTAWVEDGMKPDHNDYAESPAR